VASDLAAEFADGAAFVPLAAVRDAALVPATIAVALGVRGGEGKPPQERLLGFLGERELLLVLDNCEQVMDAGPALVDLLVNSPLRLSGERLFTVPPLALPEQRAAARESSALPPLTELAAVEAVRLFVDRAQAVASDFTLDADNAPAVSAICERADGLPLAIELAAARTALLSPAALLARLERQLSLLVGGPLDQPLVCAPCATPSPGVMTCSTRTSGASFANSLFLWAAARPTPRIGSEAG
jgi:predicted ATPase